MEAIKENQARGSTVAVVVPSYDHARFIERCLRSIFKQSHPPVQLLVIDDGSTDGSPRIIERVLKDCPFPCEMIVRPNKGLCATLNEGFGRTSGELFTYLGSDDMWHPDRLKEAVRVLQEHPGAVLAYGDYYIIDEEDAIIGCTRDRRNSQSKLNLEAVLSAQYAANAAVMTFRREAVARFGWNEAAKLEDYELLLHLAWLGPFAFTPRPLGFWRSHGRNTCRQPAMMLDEVLKAQRRFGQQTGMSGRELRHYQSRAIFKYADAFLMDGARFKALRMSLATIPHAHSLAAVARRLIRLAAPQSVLRWRRNRGFRRALSTYGSFPGPSLPPHNLEVQPFIGSDPVRVMHVMGWLGSGGVERLRLSLAKGLDQKEFQQKVLALEVPNHLLCADLQNAGVAVQNMRGNGTIFDLKALFRIYQEIRRWKPDIVHGGVFEGNVLGGIAGILSGAKNVVLEEASDLYCGPRSLLARTLVRLVAWRSSAYIAVAPRIGEYLVKEHNIPARLVRVIWNGAVEPKKPAARDVVAERKRLGIPEDAFVIGTVGRLDNSVKRFTDIIDAISLLSINKNEVYLLIIGDGPDQVLLKRYAREKGVKDRVIFAGYQHDPGLFYSLMHVFVLASAREGFGLVLAEAMFCALPVVATNVSSIPEIVVDGKTGFLVPPFTPQALAAALTCLYESPDLRQQMGALGRQRAKDKFSEQKYVGDIRDLYLGLQ